MGIENLVLGAVAMRNIKYIAVLMFMVISSINANDKVDVSRIFGKIQYVNAFPDYKVEVVEAFADLKVKEVDSFPDKAGEWQIVDAFPDFKIQKVKAFGDFKIKYVDAFPGVE